jgi:hypothetical protein
VAVLACVELVTTAAGETLCVSDVVPVTFGIQLDAETLVTGYALGVALVLLPWALGWVIGQMDRILSVVGR